MLKNVEFCNRVAELQAGAADNAEITLSGLLSEIADNQKAAFTAGQHSAVNSAIKLKAELSGLYVQRSADVTTYRSEAEIDARLRELLTRRDPA
jgi:hypothetical protein